MKKVLFIDSGSGGVNVLKQCVQECPHCDFLYFCDNANLPYGNKSVAELESVLTGHLENIKTFFDFDIVVLACNTLSCTCLQSVREKFADTIFVGTVPAIKPALEEVEEDRILVLATENTLEHNELIKKHPHLQKVCISELAECIDNSLDDLSLLQPLLQESLCEFEFDAIVLGCTHYFALRDLFEQMYEGRVKIFDSSYGVAKRLASFAGNDDLSFKVQFMTSGDPAFLSQLWSWYNK